MIDVMQIQFDFRHVCELDQSKLTCRILVILLQCYD